MARKRSPQQLLPSAELSQQTVQLLTLLPLTVQQLEERIQDAVEENPFLALEASEDAEAGRWRQRSLHRREDEPADALERARSRHRDVDLHSHLAMQLRLCRTDEELRTLALGLLGWLDTHGTLITSLENLSAALSRPLSRLEEALALIQSLEPEGVGARDLGERLSLQLRREDCRDPYACRICQEHLEDMAAGRVGKIARALGCTTAEVERSFALIRTLDPDPCAAFESPETPVYVRPDVYAEPGEQGWELRSASGLAERLRRCSYQLEVEADDAAALWIRSRRQEAEMLLNSVRLYRHTVFAVTAYILDVQRENALDATRPLRPLRLEDIAAATGLSVSTVSRVVQGKIVALPQGSRALRSFLSKGRGKHSVDQLQRHIQELCALTPPLDDAAIAERLSLPRRTVAKYRLELGIPPARDRRK